MGLGFIIVGVVRGCKRGRLTLSEKLDYGFVLKLIFLSLATALTIVSVVLTFVFIVAWAIHTEPPGTTPVPLDAFFPTGYVAHYVMGLVAAGALAVFALAIVGYLDHINTG